MDGITHAFGVPDSRLSLALFEIPLEFTVRLIQTASKRD